MIYCTEVLFDGDMFLYISSIVSDITLIEKYHCLSSYIDYPSEYYIFNYLELLCTMQISSN